MIVCALLLFGIAFLTLSVNAASTFSWFASSGGGTAADTGPKGPTNNMTDYPSHNMDTGNIVLSPIAGHSITGKSRTFDSGFDNSNSGTSKFTDINEGPLEPSLVRTNRRNSLNLPDSGSIDASSSGTSAEAPKDSGTNTGAGDSGSPASPGNSSSGSSSEAADSESSSASLSSGSHHHHKDSDDDRSINISKITLNTNDLNLKKGDSALLTATISPSNTTQSKTIAWSSSDKSVAIVDGSGKVTAVEGGTATVTATTSNGKTAVCKVTVSVPTQGIKLNHSELLLIKSTTSAALVATVTPNDASNQTVTWSSSNESVATVDGSGKVTAVEGGTATITATTSNGKAAACKVTVSVPATKITLSLSDVPVERGKTIALIATLDPPDSTDKILWATSDNTIATVNSSGLVTGISPGTATITASVGDKGISASCKITTVVSISELDLSETSLNLKKGEEHMLTATILPEDTTEDKTMTWSSSDDSIATVDNSGKVTAVKGGTAIITAQTGKHSAQCMITVVVPVTGITFSQDSYTITKGTAEALSPVIAPADATDKSLVWGSSDQSIATVDNSGNVTAVKVGTTTITAITHDGGYVAQCTVKVVVPVTGITLDKTEMHLEKGNNDLLTAVITPEDATNKSVTWYSSNSAVATVDSSGRVNAVGGGSAVISATTEDGQYVATCTINVVIPVTGVSVSPTALELIKGTTGTVTAAIFPSDAMDKTVFWSSSDSNIASVDSFGKISANNVGAATITAKTKDGGYTTTCAVTVKPNTFTVMAIAGSGGSVSGGGVYQAGSDVTLTATPIEHYHFVHWTDTGGSVIGTGGTYTISNLSADTTVHAIFAIDTFTVTVTAGTGGTATGGGTYPYGKVITLTATPDVGYKFLGWSDGDLTNPRNYTVNKDVMLTAKFIPLITYTITGHSTEPAWSGASKEGIYFAWEQEKHNHSWAGITVTFDQQIAWKHLDVVEINRDNDVSFSGEIYSPQYVSPVSSWGDYIEKFPFFNQYGVSCDLSGQVLTSISFSVQCTMHYGYADYKLIMTDMDGHKYYLNDSGNAIAQ